MKNKLPEKFWIEIYNEDHWNAVVGQLKKLGKSWVSSDQPYAKGAAISVEKHPKSIAFASTGKTFYEERTQTYGHPITTDFLFSCEFVKKIDVTLNASYTEEVTEDGVKVGCQTFPLDIIDKLVDARKQLD